MDDAIRLWIAAALECGGDVWGEARFWRGNTLWLLVGLFFLVNLFIMVALLARPLTRSASDR